MTPNPGRKRGRPRGTISGKRLTDRWEPKTWKPLYDSIIALAVLPMKQVDIAKRLGITPMTVGLVLNSLAGKNKLAQLQVVRDNALVETQEARIKKLQDIALSRVEAVINDSELLEAAPFKMFDRSMSVLRATGIVAKSTEDSPAPANITNFNTLIADAGLANQISSGVAKALLANQLNAGSHDRIDTGASVKEVAGPRQPKKVP